MAHHAIMTSSNKSHAGSTAAHIASAFKPNVASLGYALFLAINATAVWGGVFPFLPRSIQTQETMFWFYLAMATTFAAAFFASVFGVYRFPERAKRFMVPLVSVPYVLAWVCLIGAGYMPDASSKLVILGGALLGVGSAGFYMLWQRLFAAESAERGNRDLVVGTAYSSIIYFALHAIPEAVTSLLVPLVFLPLFALAIILTSREINLEQPMFQDIPSEHPDVYRRAVADTWRSALSLGGLGFCTGIMRAVAITGPEVGAAVNMISMGAGLIAAAILLVVWSMRSVKISVLNMYSYAFLAILVAFLLLPVVPFEYVGLFAGLLYAMHSVGILFMMIQCAQVSRDRGINPVFIYGVFGGTMYGMHDIGFITGSVAETAFEAGVIPLSSIALLAVCVLGILYALGRKREGERAAVFSDGNSIELVGRTPLGNDSATLSNADVEAEELDEQTPNAAADAISYTDRIARQVELVKQDYGLSTRESEVTELLARGETVARIAEALFISENTVRMHSKRIYAKLDVHKKQQLRDLVESYDPGAVA